MHGGTTETQVHTFKLHILNADGGLPAARTYRIAPPLL